ncbi:MAG: 50S ribosomal protein L17 [Saprospiraceae bacterium]|jgi:large subunit ribosomal protein L17|nr:50S ribosomal protein L17 [Saprospiraceae bacterium]
MRHGNKVNHLGRKTGHRDAMLKNIASSLIQYKRINTTLAKARVLRSFLEPLITKAKDNTTHSRRVVFSYLQNKEAIKELFATIAPKILNRPGGYLRVIKTGWRSGDAAEMALIEFVDFNEVYVSGTKPEAAKSTEKKKKTRRSSKKTKADGSPEDSAATESASESQS